ncbi:hypothetical protein [Bradyrhizobium canariense]|uniref:hypothetical protein n=1 Tax=Bradyrhizobium canariense TaxID=255045 RepID=UPI001B8A3A76|nr:hypothetical protein [Bradyrhizobium canariense]MBR0954145.1 hypothetical protein [Bradyrhizobium canariense]
MARLSLDDFIDAFAAKLVSEGQNVLRLNEPRVRDGLFRVYRSLDDMVRSAGKEDAEWRRSLLNIKSVFQPSPIGSFDRFEALMRTKQVYLTDHPNPYYQDIMIRIPDAAAKSIVDRLDKPLSEVVTKSVQSYLAA